MLEIFFLGVGDITGCVSCLRELDASTLGGDCGQFLFVPYLCPAQIVVSLHNRCSSVVKKGYENRKKEVVITKIANASYKGSGYIGRPICTIQ